MNAVYDIPTMTSPNFNKRGGLMDVTDAGNGNVRVVQRMPDPGRPSGAWLVVSDATMSEADFNAHVKPSIELLGGKQVR